MNSSTFTHQARAVLELARGQASARHHERVDPEHILLGLMVEQDGAGSSVLEHAGVDLRDVRARVERQLRPGRAGRAAGPHFPYTARAKRVLELAMRESRDSHHDHVGSEHLVIAVMREKGLAARALAEAGASLDSLRKEASRLLSAGR